LNMLLEAVDSFAGEVQDYRVEKVSTEATLFRQNRQLQDHETRIHKLEEKAV